MPHHDEDVQREDGYVQSLYFQHWLHGLPDSGTLPRMNAAAPRGLQERSQRYRILRRLQFKGIADFGAISNVKRLYFWRTPPALPSHLISHRWKRLPLRMPIVSVRGMLHRELVGPGEDKDDPRSPMMWAVPSMPPSLQGHAEHDRCGLRDTSCVARGPVFPLAHGSEYLAPLFGRLGHPVAQACVRACAETGQQRSTGGRCLPSQSSSGPCSYRSG